MLDYSVLNYEFTSFNHLDDFHRILGHMFIIFVVIMYKFLITNLILSSLSNIFSSFQSHSEGLYLSMILSQREEKLPNDVYDAFILGISPLNIVTVPFLPYAIFC